MKKTGMLGLMAVVAIMMMVAGAIDVGAKTVPIEGVSYNVKTSLADNLKTLVGKRVYVTLDSGTTFIGTVKEVGDHLLHLEKLDRKDYFDALIQIKNIIALDTKFRDFAR
jgi:small nuclear ribonucleoprotein (snRNP)-like protein